MMAPIRTFVAIDISSNVRKALVNAIHGFRDLKLNDVRWIKPCGIHLTLKFLGDINPCLVQPILVGLKKSTEGVAAFKLGLSTLGAFPNIRNPRTLWVGLQGDLEELKTLQSRIERNLQLIGFPKESRAFTPHLTIGRVRNNLTSGQIRTIDQGLGKTISVGSDYWTIDAVHLIQSNFTPNGTVYRKLGTVIQEL